MSTQAIMSTQTAMSRQPVRNTGAVMDDNAAQALAAQASTLLEQDDLMGAWALLEASREAVPGDAALLVIASRVMRLRGRADEALALTEQALALDQQHGEALVERARLAREAGDMALAHAWYQRAWVQALAQAQPGQAWVTEWVALMLQAGMPGAQEVLTRFCEAAPHNASGWFHRGLLHQCARRHREALEAYTRAAELEPAWPMLQNNMAAAHLELGDWAHAQTLLQALLAREPENVLAWNNLAAALLRQGELAAAEVAIERACRLAPHYPVALATRAVVHREQQQWEGARAMVLRALAAEPANPAHVWSLAMLQLLAGDYENGWKHHEARWQGSPELMDVVPNLPTPRWQGESLRGRTLFVWGEQGFGDAMQFVRFVPVIAERVRREGGQLVYCCFAPLLPLFARSLHGVVDRIVPHDVSPVPAHDVHLPLASLPLMLGVRVSQLPVAAGYLRADPAAVRRWQARHTAHTPRGGRTERAPLRVGLVWSGSSTHRRNPLRSIAPLEYARAFREIDGVEFVSLQRDGQDEAAGMRRAGLALRDPTGELETFDDTAALVGSLDLVITVCTSMAHLAGAMNVPTWVLLDVNPHWVWMTGRSDSAWYPSVTLYRQQAYRQWEPVLARVAADLGRRAARGQPTD